MRLLQSVGCFAPATILIYGVVGLLLLGQFGGQVLGYLGSLGWEETIGTVVSSDVQQEWDTTGERYIGQVIYTYEVDGVLFEGNQVDLRGPVYLGNPDDAQQRVAPYSAGTSVTVHFDPSDPAQAVLDRRVPEAVWWIVSVGSALVLLSLGLGVRHVISQRKNTQNRDDTSQYSSSEA